MEILYPLEPPRRRRDSNKAMIVLCLGLSRSGTDSLRTALLMLGFDNVYHGFVITAKQREDCAFWVPLMRQKFANNNQPLRGIDFDNVLATCQAVTDGPANVFGEELLEYYPDAKVILNRRRDMDAWHDSMRKTCLQVFSWPMWLLSWFDTGLCWLWWNFDLVMVGYYFGDFELHGKRVAALHYERLERALSAQQRDYLDWSVEDGWEPLCQFLGRPIPATPFPHGNQASGQFQMNMAQAVDDLVRNAVRNAGLVVVTVVIIVVAVMVNALWQVPTETRTH